MVTAVAKDRKVLFEFETGFEATVQARVDLHEPSASRSPLATARLPRCTASVRLASASNSTSKEYEHERPHPGRGGQRQARPGNRAALRARIAGIDLQVGNVFGPSGQPSSYLIGLQETLRGERERYETEIETLEALSDDDVRRYYTPVEAQPVAQQQPGFDPALNAVLANGAAAPAGFVPGQICIEDPLRSPASYSTLCPPGQLPAGQRVALNRAINGLDGLGSANP